MNKLRDTIRGHWQILVGLTVLIAVMTFPTILYVFNTEVFWLPTGGHRDTWIRIWDA